MELLELKKRYNQELKSLKKADNYFKDNPNKINITSYFSENDDTFFVYADEGIKLTERYKEIIRNLSKLIDEIEKKFNVIVTIEEKEEGFTI